MSRSRARGTAVGRFRPAKGIGTPTIKWKSKTMSTMPAKAPILTAGGDSRWHRPTSARFLDGYQPLA